MAFAGRSPTRTYTGSSSPTKALHVYTEPQTSSAMYGIHRPMLPPSPQHYNPRSPATTIPTSMSSLPSLFDMRTNQPPHKRPDSSMSISSMLGGEPEKPQFETSSIQGSRTLSQPVSGPMPLPTGGHTFMSPPHFPSKAGYSDYPYKPRSRTPDKSNTTFPQSSTRQRSSSSGTAMQRPGMFDEPRHRSTASTPTAGLHDPFVTPFGGPRDDDRARRTSLSGALQRPNSQPQSSAPFAFEPEPYRPTVPPLSSYDRNPPLDLPKPNGTGGIYDIKPPGINGHAKSLLPENVSPPKSLPHSVSPELRRSSLNGAQGRGLANILNGPTSQPAEPQSASSQRMIRQDSAQSQSDRSVFGERTKFRAYSPFNSSFTSNPDEMGRKGSDELSQHRAILSLAQENKRGRYSPVPQAVQGAQAQSPVPDATAKSDRGRVFSGIGGGIRTTPTPSSPFKKDETPLKLSEDNLKNLSRNASGGNKRSRKTQEDEGYGNVNGTFGEKPAGRKRGKHQHNYKADLEEMAQAGFPPQRGSSMGGLTAMRNTSTPGPVSGSVGYLQPRSFDTTSLIKHKKVVHVSGVFDAVAKMPRRHLGTFTYRPNVAQAEGANTSNQKFQVSITPNLLPSFADPKNVNCTYTVHVPRLWLQPREHALISAEHHVWGSGIYTDDSDPVAAAMHAGFLKAGFGDGVDANLLAKIVQEQNPRVEFPNYVRMPTQPLNLVENKDLKITLVVLPLLEKYEGTNRYGIRSRTWPSVGSKSPHDGVSFGVLDVEFIDLGIEEMRLGRTGHSRRERLRTELEARRKGLHQQRQRWEIAKRKRAEQLRKKVGASESRGSAVIPKSVPTATMSNRQTARSSVTGLHTPAVSAAA